MTLTMSILVAHSFVRWSLESAASGASAPVRLVFQGRDDFAKPFHVGSAHAPHDGSLQRGQMAANAPGQLSPLRCQHDEECAAIRFSYFARDQATVSETVENTG